MLVYSLCLRLLCSAVRLGLICSVTMLCEMRINSGTGSVATVYFNISFLDLRSECFSTEVQFCTTVPSTVDNSRELDQFLWLDADWDSRGPSFWNKAVKF